MFERFTRETRDLVVRAVDEASALAHARIGTGHLLLAMLARPETSCAPLLEGVAAPIEQARRALGAVAGPAEGQFDDIDAEALRGVGVSLQEVRRGVEATFGPGALDRPVRVRSNRRFTDAGKQAVFLVVEQGKRFGHRRLDARHLLMALLDQPGPTAAQLALDRLGADRSALRERAGVSLGS